MPLLSSPVTSNTVISNTVTNNTVTSSPITETVRVGDSLWRVVRVGGDLLGYIDRIPTPDGDRFRVRRMLATQRRFIAIGEFWAFDDAIACFRF